MPMSNARRSGRMSAMIGPHANGVAGEFTEYAVEHRVRRRGIVRQLAQGVEERADVSHGCCTLGAASDVRPNRIVASLALCVPLELKFTGMSEQGCATLEVTCLGARVTPTRCTTRRLRDSFPCCDSPLLFLRDARCSSPFRVMRGGSDARRTHREAPHAAASGLDTSEPPRR